MAVALAGPCKQSAPHSSRKTTLIPHRSTFTGRMFFMTPNQQIEMSLKLFTSAT